MPREPEAKLSHVIERLDRIEHQIAPLAAAPLGAASVPGKAAAGKPAQIADTQTKPSLENAHGERKIGGRGDAFDPSQHPSAPGVPRPLGSLASAASTPQLITNWVVRDVYAGVALVESPHGSMEVTPGEIIPGAGTVKSIERRGARLDRDHEPWSDQFRPRQAPAMIPAALFASLRLQRQLDRE